MVKGMTRDLFNGTEKTAGLAQYLTVFGDGRININTAPLPVLLALAETMTTEDARRLDEHRRDGRNDLANADWYQVITERTGMSIPATLITARSDIFRVTSVGLQGRMKEHVHAVVKRAADRRKITLLSWKVE